MFMLTSLPHTRGSKLLSILTSIYFFLFIFSKASSERSPSLLSFSLLFRFAYSSSSSTWKVDRRLRAPRDGFRLLLLYLNWYLEENNLNEKMKWSNKEGMCNCFSHLISQLIKGTNLYMESIVSVWLIFRKATARIFRYICLNVCSHIKNLRLLGISIAISCSKKLR